MSNMVREELDDNGDLEAYECENVDNNKFAEAEIPFYYDLVHPCSVDKEDGERLVSSKLVEIAALAYRISPNQAMEADGCLMPPEMFEDDSSAWLMGVSSLPEDTFVTSFGCQKLTLLADGECCIVVEAKMTFTPVGEYNENEFKRFVGERLNSGAVTDSTNFRVAYLGSELEYVPEQGRGNIPPPIVNPPEEPDLEPEGKSFTIYGGIVIAALVVTFIGVFSVIIRRRRRFLKDRAALEAAVSKPDLEMQGSHDSGDGPTLEVDVMSDEIPDRNASTITDSFDGREDSDQRGSYTFDLGDSYRDQVVGAYGYDQYGPTTIAVVPPYPMEETSDSEADSWAQTDGTVGSLEDRLEEITAEI